MKYQKIVVAGGGILGSQIAYQSAYSGFDVTILIRPEDNKDEVIQKLEKLESTYLETIKLMASEDKKARKHWARGIALVNDFNKDLCITNTKEAKERIQIVTDQKEALTDADLLIESITENIDIKSAFYKQISPLLEEKTVVVTNTSTLLPSKLMLYVKNRNKFLALHFANSIWKNNIAEVMKTELTEEKYFDEIMEFAKAIKMIPLPVKVEKSGYLLNSLLVPFLLSGMDLLANGVSDPESIDKAWTLGTGAPKGPFQIIDTVGLTTAREIVKQYQKVPNLIDPLLKKMLLPYNFDGMLRILDKYIEEGKLGVSSGEGFYIYNKDEEE